MGCFIPSTAQTDILSDLDITGWNYAARHRPMREKYPEKPLVYSESASALSTRGFYELPHPTSKVDYSDTHQVDSYDLNAAPWSDLAEIEFDLMREDNYLAGEFVWTGFDYLGEPTPFSREARSSYFGIVDLCGMPKDRYFLYRSHWRPEATTVHILPHWNWAGHEGEPVPVFVYTNGDSAELFVNGKSQGVRRKGELPELPPNLAVGGEATSSSTAEGSSAEAAFAADGGWYPTEDDRQAWWQIDLGTPKKIGCVALEFDRESKLYGYRIEASDDGNSWKELAAHRATRRPMWGGASRETISVDATARYLRVTFTRMIDRARAHLKQFFVYDRFVESPYYAATYNYRLRWEDVAYQPGEVRAVAYRDGQKIGESVVHTAGPPAAIRLTPDRTKLDSSGDDLSHVLVEAVDAEGNPCPLADNLVKFNLDGPVEIAGVGNGNPLSYEPFQADQRKLFYGKAMLILRSTEGAEGEIGVQATSEGLTPGRATLTAGDAAATEQVARQGE
jgi:hypothetical protein